jgi:hypothetical protein
VCVLDLTQAIADLEQVLAIDPAYERAHQLMTKLRHYCPPLADDGDDGLVPPPPLAASISSSLGSVGSRPSSDSSSSSARSDSSSSTSTSRSASQEGGAAMSPASVAAKGELLDALHVASDVLGDLGIVEDDFDISLLSELFDSDTNHGSGGDRAGAADAGGAATAAGLANEGGAAPNARDRSRSAPAVPVARPAASNGHGDVATNHNRARSSSSPKRHQRHGGGGGVKKKPRTPPTDAAGSYCPEGEDSLDAMIDNAVLDKASSHDWAGGEAAAWFSLD